MAKKAKATTFEELAETVRERLAQNLRIRRNLPGGGRLRIDRQLPFLCVYRRPANRQDVGTADLVTSEAAYLIATGGSEQQAGIAHLCNTIRCTLREHFGLYLFVEVWADPTLPVVEQHSLTSPGFRIVTSDDETFPRAVQTLEKRLSRVELRGRTASAKVVPLANVAPPDLPPLMADCSSDRGCFHIGIGVQPAYRIADDGPLYPVDLQHLRRQFSDVLRGAISDLTGARKTESQRAHYQTLGPSHLVKAAALVDQQLSEVSESFDLLLQVTPVNSETAWNQFQQSQFTKEPEFLYRPLPYQPSLLKRRLFNVPLERMEDVTLSHLFWEKQQELDRQISLLQDIDTPAFRYGSLQLYGGIDEELRRLAEQILASISKHSDEECSPCVPFDEVVAAAREQVNYYHARLPAFNARIEVNEEIASGIMVAKDRLMISASVRVPQKRLDGLLQHEIGTHLLTYFNGRQQPFRQLYAGLAGYEGLQEGLAVLAEYLVEGLTPARLRLLAGRVIAVHTMLDGGTFLETFRRLHADLGFTARTAFTTSLRVFRGGGLTKDAIYLRGLRDLLSYLGQGHDLEPLFVGKIALQHVPFVQELRRRGVVQPPALMPRYWADDHRQQRLEECRGRSVLELGAA